MTEALTLYGDVLQDLIRVAGSDHPDTLLARSNVAVITAKSGDRAEALRLATELLTDQERVLGSNHPDTVATRSVIKALSYADG